MRITILFIVLLSLAVYGHMSLQTRGRPTPKPKCKDEVEVYERRMARSALQEELVTRLYDTIIWPRGTDAVYQASANGNLTTPRLFFADDATIHLPPIGSFTGPGNIIDYYWGLSGPIPGGAPRNFRVTNVDMSYVECWNNTCTFQAHIRFKFFPPGANTTDYNNITYDGDSSNNYTHHGTIFFNANNKICGGQINFVHAAWEDANSEDPTTMWYIRHLTCETVMAQCTGANQQYANYTSCMDFMSTKVYGGFYRHGEDTVGCRLLHAQLQAISPEAAHHHCPHSGPSGGGKCTHKDGAYYGSSYVQNYNTCRDPNF